MRSGDAVNGQELDLYRVPGLMNPRLTVWALDCAGCGQQVRLGPGTRAALLRGVAAAGGPYCAGCRSR